MTSAQDLAGLPSRPCSCYCDPPKTFCISIVVNFSWDGCNTKEKRKTKVMQNFGKQIRCIMGDLQVVNKTKNVVVFGRKMV